MSKTITENEDCDSNDNKKKHRVSIRMINKSILSGHADVQMSNKNCYQYEFRECDMAKCVDGREILDVLEDKFAY